MAKRRRSSGIARRNFLKSAGIAGAAVVTPVASSVALPAAAPPPLPAARLPNLVAETLPPPDDPIQQSSSDGDFMVDVMKTLNFEYVTMTPASSYRGLHEALVLPGPRPVSDFPILNDRTIARITYSPRRGIP